MLWNSNQIDNFDGDRNDIIVLKNIKVSDYYGIKSLNLQFTTKILINPNLDDVKK